MEDGDDDDDDDDDSEGFTEVSGDEGGADGGGVELVEPSGYGFLLGATPPPPSPSPGGLLTPEQYTAVYRKTLFFQTQTLSTELGLEVSPVKMRRG